jgi:hypothetical protein
MLYLQGQEFHRRLVAEADQLQVGASFGLVQTSRKLANLHQQGTRGGTGVMQGVLQAVCTS